MSIAELKMILEDAQKIFINIQTDIPLEDIAEKVIELNDIEQTDQKLREIFKEILQREIDRLKKLIRLKRKKLEEVS